MTRYTKAEQTEARAYLLEVLQPGATVYTVCTHVASSGMSRVLELLVALPDSDGKPYIRRISWLACKAAGFRWSKAHEGLQISGCGQDMGFYAVYCLGRSLWPDGTPEPHGQRNGQPDTDGGYALRHQWL
ncbi:MAG: hypothetical protein ACO23P_11430 [Vulcanococcus sp.]